MDRSGAVVITGTSSGIGEATALHLNELGYTVFGTVRHPEDGERLRARAHAPERVIPLLADVTDPEAVTTARDDVLAHLAERDLRLAGVFSNAGIAELDGDLSCEGCPIATQRQVMEVNHFGAVRVVQAFLPALRASSGRVVFNSALMTHFVLPFNAGYASSKRALEGFADSLRREVRPFGVRVVIIRAAAISSAMEAKQDASKVPADTPYRAQRPMLEMFLSVQAKRAGSRATSPLRFAEKVVHALEHPSPPPRMIVGGGSKPIWAIGLLPDRAQDALVGRVLGVLARRAERT